MWRVSTKFYRKPRKSVNGGNPVPAVFRYRLQPTPTKAKCKSNFYRDSSESTHATGIDSTLIGGALSFRASLGSTWALA